MPSLLWDLPNNTLANPSYVNGAAQDPGGDEVWILTQAGPRFGMYNMVTNVWTNLPAPPYSVGGSWGCIQLVKIGEFIWDFTGTSGVIGRYDIAAGSWSTSFDATYLRSEALVAAYGTDVYLAGGEGAGTLDLNIYHTANNTWTVGLPDLPAGAFTTRHAGAAVFVGDKFVAIGGRCYAGGSAQAVSRVDIYDISRGSWSDGPTLHRSLRSHSAVAMHDGTVWVGPGNDQNGASTTAKRTINRLTLPELMCVVTGDTSTNTCSEYDVGGGFPPVLPYAMVSGAAAARCDSMGTFYLFGGTPWNGFDPSNVIQRFFGFDAITITPPSEGFSIYVAPEPIVHRFTAEDFMDPRKAQATAKKLNDNFDAAERQLLALDPDVPDSRP